MSPIFTHTFGSWRSREHQAEVSLWQFADLSFAVTYGKETHERIGYAEAAMKLGEALMHSAACAGLIDNGPALTPDNAHRAALALSDGNLGQFAAYLGDAYCAADKSNRLRLVQAFAQVFAHGLQYADQCRTNETSRL